MTLVPFQYDKKTSYFPTFFYGLYSVPLVRKFFENTTSNNIIVNAVKESFDLLSNGKSLDSITIMKSFGWERMFFSLNFRKRYENCTRFTRILLSF